MDAGGKDAKANEPILKLMEAVDSYIPTPERAIDKPLLMAVEDVFSISGRGTVATGRMERGKVKVGDKVELVGLRETRDTVVTGVEMFRKSMDEAIAGDNVGLLLRGIEKEDVERGMCVVAPKSITPHTKFKGSVYVLTKEEGGRHTPFFNGYRPQFYFRTTDVTGVATLPEGREMVMPGDNVDMEVELITPIAMEKELRFAIREGGRTVGAGVVTEIIGSKDANDAPEDPHQAEVVRSRDARPVGGRDRAHGAAHRRGDVGPGAAADPQDGLHRAAQPARGQEVARAVRDPHPQAADRHHALDRPDHGSAREARHPGGRRHRDQDVRRLSDIGPETNDDDRTDRQESRHDPALRREGRSVPVTVIEAGPCTVTEVRTAERDGYTAVQLGFGTNKESRFTRPVLGQFKKRNLPAVAHAARVPGRPGRRATRSARRSTVALFEKGAHVDVQGITKGRGFPGVVKRYGFVAGTPRTARRSASSPARSARRRIRRASIKGKRLPGRMGGEVLTTKNLEVVGVDPEQNVLLVRGAVPGPAERPGARSGSGAN